MLRLPAAEGPPEGCSTAPRHAACGGPITAPLHPRYFSSQPCEALRGGELRTGELRTDSTTYVLPFTALLLRILQQNSLARHWVVCCWLILRRKYAPWRCARSVTPGGPSFTRTDTDLDIEEKKFGTSPTSAYPRAALLSSHVAICDPTPPPSPGETPLGPSPLSAPVEPGEAGEDGGRQRRKRHQQRGNDHSGRRTTLGERARERIEENRSPGRTEGGAPGPGTKQVSVFGRGVQCNVH